MTTNALTAASKLLSYVLRHRPDSIGLVLDAHGWAGVDTLLARLQAHGHAVDRALLERVVAGNDKQRFAFSADGVRIRASQGHSVAVDLGLAPQAPPPVLYHGTASRFMTSILALGLRAGACICRATRRRRAPWAHGMAFLSCWSWMRSACTPTGRRSTCPTTVCG